MGGVYYDFPNYFAKRIASKVGLLEIEGCADADAEEILGEFQHFAILSEFEESMQAYYINDIDMAVLSDEQVTALKAIHAATRPWVLGRTMAHVLDNLSNDPIKSAEIILNKLLANGEVNSNEVEALFVTLTKGKEKKKK